MPEPLRILKNVVDAVHPLNFSDWESLASIWKPVIAKRKEILTNAGEKENHLYFVIEGVQRVFYFDEQQREATLVFTYAPSFGGVLDSFLLQQPSRYSYETLTPSAFIRTTAQELFQVAESSQDISTFIQKGTTRALSGLLERMVELQCFHRKTNSKLF